MSAVRMSRVAVGVIALTTLRSRASGTVDGVDAIPPARKLVLLSLQHVLVMYAGAVAVPLVIGRALNLPHSDIALLISADLFACGIATLIQTLGLPGFGIRLPIMMGVTFASVEPMLAIIQAGDAAGHSASVTLSVIFGSVIFAGVVGIVIAPFASRLSLLFPPLVTGTVILVIGISLINVGVDWAAGGQVDAADYGTPVNLLLALLVLALILVAVRYGRGLIQNSAVLLGVAGGTLVAAALGMTDFSAVETEPWLRWVQPMRFGWPRFELAACLSMCLVMVVIMVESFGMFLAVGAIVETPVSRHALARGLRADALATVIGGVFNTFPHTSFSQNIGLIGVTGVYSRFVCAAGGVLLLLLSLSPKLSAAIAAIPEFVLGGAGLVMFGMIAATGIRILNNANIADDRNNLTVMAVSLSVGMIPLVAHKFFQFAPAVLGPLLHSGILLATFTAVLLNLFLNGLQHTSSREGR